MNLRIFDQTVRRLARCGVKDPTAQIIALSEEIKGYRERIYGLEDALRKGSGACWVPATTLPPDGETVLVWFEYFRFGDYNRPFQTYGLGEAWGGEWSRSINGEGGWRDLKIIGWQPLPNPPKEG